MSRICVKNLPKYVAEDRLREFFSQKGEITDAKLMRTKDGKSRQFGFVGFRTEQEAEEAIKYFNKSFMDTCRITCEIARKVGDPNIPRPWSRHSLKKKENSSEKEKRVTTSKVSKAVVQEGNNENSMKDDENDDPQLQEFLQVMQHRGRSKLWANDTVAAVSLEQSKAVPDNKSDMAKGEEEKLDAHVEGIKGEVHVLSEKAEAHKQDVLVHNEVVSDMDYFRSRIKKKWSDSESSEDESSIDGTDHSDSDNNDDSSDPENKSNHDPLENTLEPDVSEGEAEDGSSKECGNSSAEPSSPKNKTNEDLECGRLFIRNLPYTATYIPCHFFSPSSSLPPSCYAWLCTCMRSRSLSLSLSQHPPSPSGRALHYISCCSGRVQFKARYSNYLCIYSSKTAFSQNSSEKMAALPTQQPQFMTTGDSRTHPNEALIDNIEYDQIVVPDQKSWKNLFTYMGPGFLVSIAYIDPGNFQTDLQSGAQFKYGLLWIILLASCAALIIQSLAANLGVVTGKHLAEHCRKEYPKVPNFMLWILAEIAIVACDIPEVIGTAFALNMLFRIPLWCGVLITGLSTLVLLLLQQYGVRKLEILIAFLVFTIAGCFFVELGYAKPDLSEVLRGLFVPQLKGSGATKLAISLLGAMVMPHNLFLHSALVLSRKSPRSVNGIKEACRFYLIESGLALMVAFFINVSVISVSGAVCNSPNLNSDDLKSCKNLDLNEASFLLKNVLGKWSSKLFAIALLASGQSSTITGTYAGQYVMQGFLDLRLKPWIRNFLTRCLAIVPSLIVAIIGGSSGAGNLIIIASMILSFELPFALIPLLKFTSCKTKMGLYANSVSISATTWIIGSFIMGINVYYLAEKLVTSLRHSHLNIVGIIFCGLLGFLAMLIYLASIAYLIIRKNREGSHLIALSERPDTATGNLPREDIVSMQLPQRRTNDDLD